MATLESTLSTMIREIDALKLEVRSLKTQVVHAPLNMGSTKPITIAAGIITVARPHVSVIPESGTADILNFIDGGGAAALAGYDGKIIVVSAYRSGDTITINHHTIDSGNISLQEGGTIALTTQSDSLMLMYKATTELWEQIGGGGSGGGGGGAVDSVNGQTGVVVLDTDDISEGVTNLWFTAAEETKLAGIEALADVTDAANMAAAIIAQPGKTTPIGTDIFPGLDSEDSYQIKEFSWTNILATLTATFNALYGRLAAANTWIANNAFNSTATSGSALSVTRDLAAANTDAPVVSLVQDNAGDDQAAFRVQQDGTGDIIVGYDGANVRFRVKDGGGVEIVQEGITGNSLNVTRDLAAASTDAPVVSMVQDNAGDDQTLLRGQQDGTGDIMQLFDGATLAALLKDGGNFALGRTVAGAKLDVAGAARYLGTGTVPSADGAGQALELLYWTGAGGPYGLVLSYDRDAAVYKPLHVVGSEIGFEIGAIRQATLTSLGLGLGTTDIETPSTNYGIVQMGTNAQIGYGKSGGVGGAYFSSNAYKDGANWRRRNNGDACLFDLNASGTSFFWAQSDGTDLADAIITWVLAWSVGNTGGLTFISPTIADFTNAPHDHGDANDGGSILLPTALTLSGILTVVPTSGTIASGVLTLTSSVMTVDTEGAAATDDLVTITAGAQGQLILLKTVSDARDVTIKHGTGNINSGGNDRVLRVVQDMWLGVYLGSAWREIVFSESNTAQEGTWLPEITSSGSAPTMTYTLQEGSWWKTGKLYNYTITLVINTITVAGTGNLRISLPVVASAAPLSGDGTCRLSGVDLPAGPLYYTFNPTGGQAYGLILGTNDNGTNTTVAVTTLANGDAIIISGQLIGA